MVKPFYLRDELLNCFSFLIPFVGGGFGKVLVLF